MCLAAFAALALAAPSTPPLPAPALPRVIVRAGQFVTADNGAAFRPRGMNYIRLRTLNKDGVTALWHDTFNPASYSAEASRAFFADISAKGYNVVRVFLDHETGPGMLAAPGDPRLSAAYIERMADFLRSARANRVRVILCFCYLPLRKDWAAGLAGAPANVEGENQAMLHPGFIRAKAAWMAETARAIRRIDPDLLSAIFSFEMENESHFVATKPPFSLSNGSVRVFGRVYDMAKIEDHLRLADDAAIQAIGAVASAVRAVDRHALVGASAFTYHAVGRSGPARHREDQSADPRFPVRPLALARSAADYVDVHFYPVAGDTTTADLAAIELDALRTEAQRRGKPMMVGEIGAFRFAYPTVEKAIEAMRSEIGRIMRAGFCGYLYWTYDTAEQDNQLWNARSGDSAILKALP